MIFNVGVGINQPSRLIVPSYPGLYRAGADDLKFLNPLKVHHYRKRKKIGEYYGWNDITNQGKDDILNIMFNDGTQIAQASWYLGLVNASAFSAFAPGDTLASHSGWTELTSYSGNRKAWGSGTSTAQLTTNATPAQFDINATVTAHGIMVCSVATGTSGRLWATAAFNADIPLSNGDQLKVTYTVSC